jgi:hypothetical protein
MFYPKQTSLEECVIDVIFFKKNDRGTVMSFKKEKNASFYIVDIT